SIPCSRVSLRSVVFFFTGPPTPATYTLSLHDALPISGATPPQCGSAAPAWGPRPSTRRSWLECEPRSRVDPRTLGAVCRRHGQRSEEHTSELQSLAYLVCRLLLEKKKPTAPMSEALYC